MKERIRYIFMDSSFVDNPDPNKENEFKRDEDFVDSLCDKYLSEVFTWMVNGSMEYYKSKTIVAPEEFQKRTDEFFALQDSITSFITKRVIVTGEEKDYLKRGELFDIYKQF
jgi:hypothetical protein